DYFCSSWDNSLSSPVF
nr:immunoglobulin light chain junction region [Macaca mulatta]MOX33290.1 immunoglobulin light chain junction region [Macaca mulatta]MOX33381.1 immunoglobulin light chain junction region [Macaca mulatta]MOX33509.1 immunoglobulin light chain junction region [Macaca mulatta]MOX33596.1 immunoglobulin light chain junction region [Macaca mulatta]